MSVHAREPRMTPTGHVPYGVLGDFFTQELAWMEDALCAEVDGELFFPEKGQATQPAKDVCARCTVRAECLDYALDNLERFGVYGGTSERERRKLLGLVEDDAEEWAA